MAGIKYSEDKYTTDNPFVDIIMANTKAIIYSCVMKDEYTADKLETLESLKESAIYISCIEGHAELMLFDRIPHSFLVSAGVPTVNINSYEHTLDQSYIPTTYHDALKKMMMKYYIENYKERNEYYRMITGLPPYGDPGIPIRDYDYLIPDYITYTQDYFHEESAQVNRSFELAGVLDVVRAEYPEYKYLNYLTQGISLYDARRKMDFSILYRTDELNYSLVKEFDKKFEECRKFVVNTQYSLAYDVESPFYHSFMMAYCLLITLIDMITEVQSHIIKKDILDRRCIQYIFSMYNIPYYRTIPYKYQERLCKNVHNLVKYKSTDTEIFNLIKLFGFEDIEVFKWFILKNRMQNAWGEFLYETTTQKVCTKNEFIENTSVTVKMTEKQNRGPLPKDITIMERYYKGFGLNKTPVNKTKYKDMYIPFPFEYYLQKGNIMIVRLDNRVLDESEYEIYDYNIIRILNNLSLGKSTITFDFYYDINTTGTEAFLSDNSNRVETYFTKGKPTDDESVFDLRDTSLNQFFVNYDNQFNVILNGVWLRQSQYVVNYIDRTVQIIDSSIVLNKYKDQLYFVFVHPVKFKSVYIKKPVATTGIVSGNQVAYIPEPFSGYCTGGNEFFVTLNNEFISEDDPSYKYTIVPSPGQSYIKLPTALLPTDTLEFHFFYSNHALFTGINVREKVVNVTSTISYQYEFKTSFPVNHYTESGYKVYIKVLGWWLPAKFFTLIGKDTVTLLDRSIASPTPGRTFELHFIYMPYDRLENPNLKVSTSYAISTKDFQKNFTINFPFNNFLAEGNKVIVDSEGILLREGIDYTISTPVGTTATVTIPNRDYRPMKSNRVNYTFYYNDNSAYKLGVDNINKGDLVSKDQVFEIPYPFFPYLETGHSFIIQVGKKIILKSEISMVDRFHCKILNLTNDDIGEPVSFKFFYNTWYHTARRGQFIVEKITQPFNSGGLYMEMQTPAEMYVENKWPYFVMYNKNLYLEETKYDVFNHTLYLNKDSDVGKDMLSFKYDNELTFVYIYSLKEGFMSEALTEVHSSNTEMYFAKAPIADMYQIQYIKDKSNWRGYDAITIRDGWWDGLYYKYDAHEVIKHGIFQKKFNYERTKYYGISNTIPLGEYSAQISYFYSMLYDDVFLEKNVDILVPVLSPSHRFNIAHLFIYMEVLTYIFNGYEDFIIDRPSKWMYVLGFNFKADMNDLKRYLADINQHNSDFPIWNYITPTSQMRDIVEFFNTFKENFKVRETILKGMIKANDYREYSIWKKIYDSLLIWKLNFDYFKKSDGTPALTYTEFLKDQDVILYQSIDSIKTITDKETLEDTIINICDAIIYELEAYIDTKEFKYLFASFPGHDSNKAAKYLYMMIDFFKSYKITLLDRTETLDTGDPNDPDNYFRGLDQIQRITESTLTADYIVPTEQFETKETMELHEWNSVPDTQSQLIEYKYPSHHANDTPLTPLDRYSNVRRLKLKEKEVRPDPYENKSLPDYDPVVTITKIIDAGRWMKEDVSIELYNKNTIRIEIKPCIIKIKKLDFTKPNMLSGKFTYTKEKSITTLPAVVDIKKELVKLSILDGTVDINAEPIDKIILTGTMTLEGRLFMSGYKMSTVYPPIFTTMTSVPYEDIPDLNIRIKYQRNSTLMTLREMYKGSKKLQMVPDGLEYTNAFGMLYYNDFEEFCLDCEDLTYFPFATQFFPYNNDDKLFNRAFYNCKKLENINNFALSEYADCNCKYEFVQAFYNCLSLKTGIQLIGVTRDLDLTEAFYNCESLINPPDIRVLYNKLILTKTFVNNKSLEYLPTIAFPTTNSMYGARGLIDMTRTFENCTALSHNTSKTGRGFYFSDTDVNADNTFYNCTSLTKGVEVELKIGAFGNFIETYAWCTNLAVSGNYTVKGTSTLTMTNTYKGCTSLAVASMIRAEDNSKVYLNNTFEDCTTLASIDNLIANYGGEYYLNNTFKNCTSLTTVTIDMSYVMSWNNIFEGCTGLTSVRFVNATIAKQFNLTHANLDGGTLSYSIIFI